MHNPRNTLANSRHTNRCSETAPAMAPRPNRVLRQACPSPVERSRDYCADSNTDHWAFRLRGIFYQYDKKRAISTSPRTSHQHARVYSPATACRAHLSDHTSFCTIHACPDRLTYAAPCKDTPPSSTDSFAPTHSSPQDSAYHNNNHRLTIPPALCTP